MSNRTVPITVPEFVWGRLATIADQKETTISDLLAEVIKNTIRGTTEVHVPTPVYGVGNERLRQLSAEVSEARRNGYRPPGAATRERFTRERRRELHAEVKRLHGEGVSDVVIAERLHIGAETARRYRVQQGLGVVGEAGRPADKEK